MQRDQARSASGELVLHFGWLILRECEVVWKDGISHHLEAVESARVVVRVVALLMMHLFSTVECSLLMMIAIALGTLMKQEHQVVLMQWMILH